MKISKLVLFTVATLALGNFVPAKASTAVAYAVEDEVSASMEAIRNYLAIRPYATDTIDGIHFFWIGSEFHISITEAALIRLESQGQIERIRCGRSICWRRPMMSEINDE